MVLQHAYLLVFRNFFFLLLQLFCDTLLLISPHLITCDIMQPRLSYNVLSIVLYMRFELGEQMSCSPVHCKHSCRALEIPEKM